MMWRTGLTMKFPCSVPIVGAPMAGVAGGLMAAEISRAGGLGFIGAGHYNTTEAVEKIDNQIRIFRSHSKGEEFPLCLGFIGYSTFRDESGWVLFQSLLRTHKPSVVLFFAPAVVSRESDQAETNISLAKKCCDCQVLTQVGTIGEAIKAVEAGTDGLITQGTGAGGHGVRREFGTGTLSLALEVISRFHHIPVIAAGGISDGRGMAAMLTAGCDGVMLGTRFCATSEAVWKQKKKEALIADNSCDDTIRTTVFDSIQNMYSDDPWPEPYDSVGALKNETTLLWEGKSLELEKELESDSSDLVSSFQNWDEEGDISRAGLLAGEGIGLIKKIEPVFDVVTQINDDAIDIIKNKMKTLLSM